MTSRVAAVHSGFRLRLAVAGAAVLVPLLVGCGGSSDGCQSGATSAIGAVEELLAASAAGDVKRACAVTVALPPAVLETKIADFAELIDGDVESLVITELPELQLGSSLYFDVKTTGSTQPFRIDVLHNSKRYLVVGPDFPYPGVDGSVDGPSPTSDPNPPS